MNIEQQVRDAFQIEHREQLQRIRALLLDMGCQDATMRGECIDEAFRMAHSLKGGARVCDLQPAEALGHGLETLFSDIREGILNLDDQLTGAINVVLDGIEDWMAALLHTESPPEPVEALRAMEELLQKKPRPADDPPVAVDPTMDQQLQTAFCDEYPRYLAGIREFLTLCDDPAIVDPRKYDDAFCLAHDLRASARAAQLREVELLAIPLERLFRSLRDGTIEICSEVRETIHSGLHDIDRYIADTPSMRADPSQPAPTAGPDAARTPAVENRQSDLRSPRRTATVENQIESVRIRADNLDRLLQSSGQLLTESILQDQVTRELNALCRSIEAMQRERASLRRIASAHLRGLAETPELRQLTCFFESAERDLHLLSQNARKLYLKQQRSSWSLRSHSTRIQADMRQARMISAHGLFQAFPKMVRDLARSEGKRADFRLVGSDVLADRMVLQALKDPVMHMLRNAVTHGIEAVGQRSSAGKPPVGQVSLEVQATGNRLQVTVQDDGCGINMTRVAEVAGCHRRNGESTPPELSEDELSRLIFDPGFSTSTSITELAGRGMGLSVVHETVKRLQGHVQLLKKETGTAILISVPLSVCTHRLLLVTAGKQMFAFPLHAIERLVQLTMDQVETLEGAPVVMHQNRLIPLTSLIGLVGAGKNRIVPAGKGLSAVIMKSGSQWLAVVVDEFVEERDALVQDLDAAAARAVFSGAILMEDGAPVLVLNPSQLLEAEHPRTESLPETPSASQPSRRAHQVLVVDDSFTTRTLEKSILETHGYQVHVAMDGVEALRLLQSHEFDAVISDLEMPRLDGFGLLEEMKRQQKLANIPVILVTSRDCLEDQRRGLELGAEAYIIKRKFDHEDLLSTIEQVISC